MKRAWVMLMNTENYWNFNEKKKKSKIFKNVT